MSTSQPKYTATMTLPRDGKAAWTKIMQGDTEVPSELDPGSPIVMATSTRFDDGKGTWAVGGVYKSDTPSEYNIIFFWAFDADGNQYPGWPIDVSDAQDFEISSIIFALDRDADDPDEYLLKIVEAE